MSSEVDSMLNEKNNVISNKLLTSQITYHKEFAPFARRPITTFLIESVVRYTGITAGSAFIRVNFTLLFLSGLLLFRLSRKLDSGFIKGICNIIIYFFSFSVLFAFFPPIFSYDEPLQYCLIFAGLHSFLEKRWAAYLFWFTAAMIARESTAFVILGIVFLTNIQDLNHRRDSFFLKFGHFILIGLPVLLYFGFIVLFIDIHELYGGTQDEFQTRFSSLKVNFMDTQSSIETITSLVVTLGIFSYFLMASNYHHHPTQNEKKFIRAFILSSILNTVIVLIAAFSREARLFSLPLVFLWPLMTQYCFAEFQLLRSFNTYLQCFANLKYLITFFLFTVVNYMISFTVYVPSFPSDDNYFNEYVFLSLQIICLHYLLRHFVSRNPNASSP